MNATNQKKIQGKEINQCFTNCYIPNTITEGRLMAFNDKFLAITMNNNDPGLINFVDSHNPCNLSENYSIFSLEDSNILDMEFSPFDSNVLAFSNENKHIHIAKIKDNTELNSGVYKSHKNKVQFINFNPVASNVICSCTSFGDIHIWDTVKYTPQIEYKLSNNMNSVLWSPNGSLIGFNQANKILRICDPRKNSIIFENPITEMNSKTKFVWLDDNSIGAIGYKLKEQKFYLNLYDIRNNIKNPFSTKEIGSYGSNLTPFVDQELKIIYIIPKEDYLIKSFDYSAGKIQKYIEFRTSEKNNFSIQLNRKYLDKSKFEIDRFARYTKTNKIYYISFILKDVSKDYIDLYYPNDELTYPIMTFEEWYQGNKTIPQKVYNKKFSDNKVKQIAINAKVVIVIKHILSIS